MIITGGKKEWAEDMAIVLEILKVKSNWSMEKSEVNSSKL